MTSSCPLEIVVRLLLSQHNSFRLYPPEQGAEGIISGSALQEHLSDTDFSPPSDIHFSASFLRQLFP